MVWDDKALNLSRDQRIHESLVQTASKSPDESARSYAKHRMKAIEDRWPDHFNQK